MRLQQRSTIETMSDESKCSSKMKRCQVVGCNVDLKQLNRPYNLKKRLCPKHMQAEAIKKEGSDALWRFCQQCGKLESLQLFEGNKRSCMPGLQRRRDSHSSAVAEKQQRKQQQQQQQALLCGQQNCQAGMHVSGLACQASQNLSRLAHHALAGCQAGNNLSGPGFQATWSPSLAAAAAAPPAVRQDCSGMLPTSTRISEQGFVYPSPAASAAAVAAVVPAAPAAATAVHLPAAATEHAPAAMPPSGLLQRIPSHADVAGPAERDDVWSKAQMMPQLQVPMAWHPAAAAAAAIVPAAPVTGPGTCNDLEPWTTTAAAAAAAMGAPSNSSTGFDWTDMAVLDEIEQQLTGAVNMMQQQAKAATTAATVAGISHAAAVPAAATAAAATVPGMQQLHGEAARAATITRLQQLTQQFEILQQALQENLASELQEVQHGVAQQQQQLLYGGVMRCASVQSSAPGWQI